MLKGCTPDDESADAFYSVDRRRRVRRIYLAMIAEFDAMVGEYMQGVKEAGEAVWRNTVWIVTSDHGDMQMERQQFYKMVPYDASASVPMVIYDGRPGRQFRVGKVVSDTTQLIDIFPTIMELCHVPAAAYPSDLLDGYSLVLFMKPLPSAQPTSVNISLLVSPNANLASNATATVTATAAAAAAATAAAAAATATATTTAATAATTALSGNR
jgi:arylsulfatase A-like enzyme